jgi:HlyD family secretion protein
MKRLLLVLVVLGLLAAGTAYWINSSNNGAENGYSYEGVKYGSMTDLVNATGIVKPRDIALVFPRLPGIVEDIYAHVGQKVAKGDRLFKINSEMAKRSLEKAEAALKKAKALRDSAKHGLDYLNKIKESKSVSITEERELEVQTKYDAAVEGVEEAESALKQAKLAMEWTTVKAEAAGTIIEKNLYIGQPVGPSAAVGGGGGNAAPSPVPGGGSSGPSTSSLFGMTEMRIPFMIAEDLGDLEVLAQIPQGDLGRVKAGLQAKFTVDAFPDEPAFEGTVTEVHLMPVNVLGTNFYPAVIKVANRRIGEADANTAEAAREKADWVLRPGMTVNVDITREIHNDVWMLPSAALSFTLDDSYITPEAKQKLATLKTYNNPNDWKTVWIVSDKDKKPWPIFVRIGGKNKQGRPGINNGSYAEVLEWEKDLQDLEAKEKLDPKNPETYLKPIIAAPQPKQSIFDKPILKFS